MKFFLVTLALLSSTVSAFVPSTFVASSPTTTTDKGLSASTTGGNFRKDDWTGYPTGMERKSTKPVAASKKVSNFARSRMDDVMIDPNYFLTLAVAALGPLIIWYHPCKELPPLFQISGIPHRRPPMDRITSLSLHLFLLVVSFLPL